jgi:hypothetical protein
MLSAVAVEVPQRRVPAKGDTMAQPVPGWSRRCPETLEADVHNTSLPRTQENPADLPCTAPHRATERRSQWP